MKDVAVVGPAFAGKSTVFNAVARAQAATGGGAQKANVSVVTVPDPRVDELGRLHDSKKLIYTQLRLTDIPGAEARSLGEARAADALAIVAPAFGDHDPAAELASFRADAAVADLQTLEKVLERVRKQVRIEPKLKPELEVYERAEAVLSGDRWLADEPWEPDARRVLHMIGALTLKPSLVVVNVDEGGSDDRAERGAAQQLANALVIRGLLEAEAAELEPDDAAALMAEFGVDESASTRFVQAVYDLLELVTFYTAGDAEARAWEVRRGATAPEAAGQIHTDLQKGFIRCETVGYDDLVAAGSWDKARDAGALRLEGKDYVVRDGDVVHVRHSS